MPQSAQGRACSPESRGAPGGYGERPGQAGQGHEPQEESATGHGQDCATRWSHPGQVQDEEALRGGCYGRFVLVQPQGGVHHEGSQLDGIYVGRTSLAARELSAEEAVRTYKQLSVVEKAFRSIKTVDLKVRPIYHYKGRRIQCHLFLCMLAYYVQWPMLERLASRRMPMQPGPRARA